MIGYIGIKTEIQFNIGKMAHLDYCGSTMAFNLPTDVEEWYFDAIPFAHFFSMDMHIINQLKGVVSKNLQKPYICGRGVYNNWGDGAYHVDTLGPTKTQGYRIMCLIHP